MFTPVKNKKIYQLIVEQIQQMIMNGELKAGDKLPGERVLAEEFNASRSSIREAVRSMEILGILESRQGEGNFIKDTNDGNWLEPLSVMFKLSDGKFDEILEMRIIIESESAALSAERMTDEERNELKLLMERLKAAETEEERSMIDQEFHVMLAEGSKNILMTTVMKAINSILRGFIEEARKSIFIWSNDREYLMAQHQRICDAIVAGDAEKARKAMNVHFDMVKKSREGIEEL